METATATLPDTDIESTAAIDAATNDTANGKRLVRKYGECIRYVWPWKQWLVWDGARWEPDDSGGVERLAKETAQAIYFEAAAEPDSGKRGGLAKWAEDSLSSRGIAAMLRMAQSEFGVVTRPDELDTNTWLLNLPNGTLDLRTGLVREHRKEDLITKICPTQFDPAIATSCPEWLKFLDRIFAGKKNLIEFVQRLLGYVLTGEVTEHVLPIFWGNGANGKSTLLETMLAVLGPDYATSATDDLLLVQKNDKHPAALADLCGRRLVVASESDAQARLAEGFVKRMTGGDKMKARWMYKDLFSFQPTHKIVLMTNCPPNIAGTDEGIWRRIRLVPFEVTIPVAERDPQLLEKLKSEARGILAWCVEGCLAWLGGGLGDPPEIQTATGNYRESQDMFGRWLAECTVTGDTLQAKTRSSELYEHHSLWCKRNGLKKPSQPKFGEMMVARGFEKKTSNGVWYLGIGIRSELHGAA